MAASDPVASTTEPSAKGEDAAPSALPSKWTYNEQMDEMRGTVTKTARLTSSNEVNLQFPYGTVSGYIEVRKRPTDGLNVIFLVDKGKIICRSYSDGHVSVQLDDRPNNRYACDVSRDGSHESEERGEGKR